MVPSVPSLPPLAQQKLDKTTYTRGASPREIYQNRVSRTSTVLIPLAHWPLCSPEAAGVDYERGYIVLVEPEWYFTNADPDAAMSAEGLELGRNALLVFRRRSDWETYHPGDILPNGRSFQVATSRIDPLGGTYFARVAGTVARRGQEVILGFNTTAQRGAGIRVFEYAPAQVKSDAKLQLEALMWLCYDSEQVMIDAGMTMEIMRRRRDTVLDQAGERGLLDIERLQGIRVLNTDSLPVCPLCLRLVSTGHFLQRTEQAEGREVHDLTTTEVSLFHIQELRIGSLQHRPYNLGWGHHFCNVVVKDAGIMPTLEWMEAVLGNQPTPIADAKESVEQALDG